VQKSAQIAGNSSGNARKTIWDVDNFFRHVNLLYA